MGIAYRHWIRRLLQLGGGRVIPHDAPLLREAERLDAARAREV